MTRTPSPEIVSRYLDLAQVRSRQAVEEVVQSTLSTLLVTRTWPAIPRSYGTDTKIFRTLLKDFPSTLAYSGYETE
jgi:hypothetical protein